MYRPKFSDEVFGTHNTKWRLHEFMTITVLKYIEYFAFVGKTKAGEVHGYAGSGDCLHTGCENCESYLLNRRKVHS